MAETDHDYWLAMGPPEDEEEPEEEEDPRIASLDATCPPEEEADDEHYEFMEIE